VRFPYDVADHIASIGERQRMDEENDRESERDKERRGKHERVHSATTG
jgi:hypothetical protein